MYLYGAGGHAKVIMDILKENSTELTGIIDDNPHIQEWMEYHVLSYDPKRMFPILISIGNNSIRKNIAEQLYKKNAVFGTVISIHAIVSPYAKIGEGSVVMQEVYCKVAAKQVNIALSTLAPLLIMNVYWKTMYMSRHTPHYVAMWKWGKAHG